MSRLKYTGFRLRAIEYSRTTMLLLCVPLQDHAMITAASSEQVSSCCRDGLCERGQPAYGVLLLNG